MPFRPAAGLLLFTLALAAPVPLAAQEDARAAEASARRHFQEGNRLASRAERLRGARRTELLERALGEYAQALAYVRSRNVLFNAAAVAQKLERWAEVHGYFREILAIPGLSPEDRTEAEAGLDEARPRIGVVDLTSTPDGATVWVDRPDLAPEGTAPIELGLTPGRHTLFLRLEAHEDAQLEVEVAAGDRESRSVTLEGEPVILRLSPPPRDGRLLLDGEEVQAGDLEVRPGPHTVRFEPEEGEPIERTVELIAGGAPFPVRFDAAGLVGPVGVTTGELFVVSNVAATVAVDGVPVGAGVEVRAPLAPGEHVVVVDAEGRTPFQRRVVIQPGAETALDVTLEGEGERPLGRLPLVLFAGAGLVSAGALGLSIRALQLHGELDDLCPEDMCTNLGEGQDKADQVSTFNLAADVTWGVAAALGLTSFILWRLNGREQGESHGTVTLAPVPGGAMLSAGARFGGAL